MITDTYNRNADIVITDNGVVQQGELSKRSMYLAAQQTANHNHPPVQFVQPQYHSPDRTTSFSKSLERSSNDDNPITQEAISDGLGALFGAATGLDGIEMIIDYGCDAIEFYDEVMLDRNGYPLPQPKQQIDPRLWMQPQPSMYMAA